MLGIRSKLQLFLFAVLAVISAALASVQPGAAQGGFTISGPAGERVPGGRIVQRGAKFTVTFQKDIPGTSYHVEGLGYYWGGGAYRGWAEDPARRVEIDTNLPIIGPIGRFSIYLTRHLQGATSAPWPDLEVIASEDIWVLNDLSPFSGALEILNTAEIRADGHIDYRVTITPEMRRFGREDDPLDADRFSTYIARLGGTLETGIAVGETTNSINRRGTTVLVWGCRICATLPRNRVFTRCACSLVTAG